jgi:hypothetical protein
MRALTSDVHCSDEILAVLELKDMCSVGTLDVASGMCAADPRPASILNKTEVLAQHFTAKPSPQVPGTASGGTAFVAVRQVRQTRLLAVVMQHVETRFDTSKLARHNANQSTLAAHDGLKHMYTVCWRN